MSSVRFLKHQCLLFWLFTVIPNVKHALAKEKIQVLCFLYVLHWPSSSEPFCWSVSVQNSSSFTWHCWSRTFFIKVLAAFCFHGVYFARVLQMSALHLQYTSQCRNTVYNRWLTSMCLISHSMQEQQTHGVGYHAYRYRSHTFLLTGYSKCASVCSVFTHRMLTTGN
jgi:hypothetical protein